GVPAPERLGVPTIQGGAAVLAGVPAAEPLGAPSVPSWAPTYRRGCLALQKIGRGTKIQFRKIEIKELPASTEATTPVAVIPRPLLVHRFGPDDKLLAPASVR